MRKDGELTQQIRRFVRSLESPLRSQLKREQRTCKVELEGSFIWLNLFPKSWRLPGDGFVAFGISWGNPFEEEAEDPYIVIRTPTLDAFPGTPNGLRVPRAVRSNGNNFRVWFLPPRARTGPRFFHTRLFSKQGVQALAIRELDRPVAAFRTLL